MVTVPVIVTVLANRIVIVILVITLLLQTSSIRFFFRAAHCNADLTTDVSPIPTKVGDI